MKQIGIITHYYGSKNYGGVLQAYALCQFLKNQGFDAEQIRFDKDKGESIKRRLGKAYRYTLSIPRRIKYRRLYKEIRGREVKFAAFRDGAICHSKEVFTQDSLNRLAKEYAKCKNLKLKVMPFLNGEISEDDLDYGDERIINASPSEFVQLIQNAEIVFTDSFHATAFSLLFERQFYVFERSFQSSMGSRIESLTELFGVQDHYCNIPNRTTFDYIYETASIDYSKEFTAFETMRKSSISYLLSNINKILEEVK